MIFGVLLGKELQEQWRTYRLLAVAVVFLVFGLLSPLIAKMTPEFVKLLPNGAQLSQMMPPPTASEAVGQYVKNISQFGVILALLLTMGAVAREKERGTAAIMLVKPVPRWAFLAAKFVAISSTFLVSTILAGAAAYYYTWLLFGALDIGGWVALNSLLFLFILVYIALTLLCSTLTRSQIVAGGLSFALAIVLALLGALPTVGTYLPAHLMAWGSRLSLGQSGSAGWPALWGSGLLILLALAAAWVVFARQEI